MKRLLTMIPLVILLCFTFSCQQREEAAEGAKAELDLKPIADKLIEVFNSQDAAALAQLYTEDQVTICSGVPLNQFEAEKQKRNLLEDFSLHFLI